MLIVGALLAVLAVDPAPAPLKLSCRGSAEAGSEHTTLHFLAKGGVSSSTYEGSHREGAHVLFEMTGGQARLHLPPAMVTQVNSGGENGWWQVSDLQVSEDAIKGRVRLNVLNKPGFTIDRTTGDIDLGGAYPFRGSCEKITQTERKF